MTTTSDNIFEDFALALLSLVDTNSTDERDEIIGDAERLIDDCGDNATKSEMTHLLKIVSRNTPR